MASEKQDRLSVAPPSLLRLTRTNLAPALPVTERTDVVYYRRTSTSKTMQRLVVNEHILTKALGKTCKSLGVPFKVLQYSLGHYPSVKEQISMFQRARLIVGPHGGGLANILWAASGTPVLEIPVLPLRVGSGCVMI